MTPVAHGYAVRRVSLKACPWSGVGRPRFGGRPASDEDKRPIKRATVRRVVDTFRPYRAQVAVVGVAIVITAGLGVVNPMLIRRVFDNALFGNAKATPPGSCQGTAARTCTSSTATSR